MGDLGIDINARDLHNFTKGHKVFNYIQKHRVEVLSFCRKHTVF